MEDGDLTVLFVVAVAFIAGYAIFGFVIKKFKSRPDERLPWEPPPGDGRIDPGASAKDETRDPYGPRSHDGNG